jgi:signal transduction histidine kinase
MTDTGRKLGARSGRLARTDTDPPKKLRVLIVEDDPLDLAIMKKVASLVEGDFVLDVAHCGTPEAVAPMLASGFDVVLLDYMLGTADGLDLLKEIRKSGDETPAIFVTSAADVNVAAKAIRCGASDYLLKSELSPDALRRTIALAVQTREAELEQGVLEERVRRLERLDAVALFAGGIAHDFNNLLTGITGWGGIALGSLPIGVDREPIQRMLEAADRASELVLKLLDATRRTEAEVMPVSLEQVTRNVVASLRALDPSEIQITYDAPPGDRAIVLGDRKRLEIAIRNLAQNGIESMPQGGRLQIRLRCDRTSSSGDLTRERPVAAVEVEDSGAGIPPEIRDRIFDAYFSTKETPAKKGLGLGLTLVQGVARSHGGRVEVQSRPGSTTFRFIVPLDGSSRVPAP